VITDLTAGTGRFNLVRGAIGTLIAIAASISTTATWFLFEAPGNWEGFLIVAATSAIATVLLWVAMPETRPANISIDCCGETDRLHLLTKLGTRSDTAAYLLNFERAMIAERVRAGLARAPCRQPILFSPGGRPEPY
jgi:hypothetical protein